MDDIITIEECITRLDAIRHEIVPNSRDHFALSAGIAALYEMENGAPAVNRWISVEDALPDVMTKQDAIEYLLYMKHDVQAKSPMDIALDTAIAALKQPEVRHGEWHESWYTDTVCASICTNCGKATTQARTKEDMTNVLYPLCPHCGARMDGGEKNVLDQ